jgi:hypothetical protein
MNIRKIALSLATVALSATGALAVTASPAAAACENGYPSTVGARVEFIRCNGSWGYSLDFTLYDTAKDGRRAELWIRFPGTSSSGSILTEVTTGAGTSESGFFGPVEINGLDVKVCTSNAGASRTCSVWY